MVRGAALRTIRSVWWALVGNGMFAEMDDAFPNSIHTVDALRTLYKQPSALVSGKKKPQLDELSAKFVRAHRSCSSEPLLAKGSLKFRLEVGQLVG